MKREITEMRLSSEKLGNLNFPAIGGMKRIEVTSKKIKYINGKQISEEIVDIELRGLESWVSYTKSQTDNGWTVELTCEENTGEYRGCDPEIVQPEGKSLLFSMGQEKVSYEYKYVFNISPTNSNVYASGGEVRVDITSYKEEYRNGNHIQDIPLGCEVGYVEGDNFNNINRDNLPNYAIISASENIEEREKIEIDRFVQAESGYEKRFEFIQAAAKVNYIYSFSISPESYNASARGDSVRVDVSSYKEKYVNSTLKEKIPVGFSVGYSSGSDFDSIDRSHISEGYVTITAPENINEYFRTETDVFTQDESNNKAYFTLNQSAASITKRDSIWVRPSILQWTESEMGTYKEAKIDSKRETLRNGKVIASERLAYSWTVNQYEVYYDYSINHQTDTIRLTPRNMPPDNMWLTITFRQMDTGKEARLNCPVLGHMKETSKEDKEKEL